MTQAQDSASQSLSRQEFLRGAGAAGAVLVAGRVGAAVPAPATGRPVISAFIKFIQDMSYTDMARWLRAAGFDGVEATVREGGYIPPARAAEELPRFADALAKEGLKIHCLTTDILSVQTPYAEDVVKAAKRVGAERYRLGFYKYDLSKSVYPQLEALRPKVRELAAFNGAHGVMGVYQNHGYPEFVGNAVWDFYSLIHDLPREQISFVYDTRHAVVEGGTMWETTWNLVQSHLGFVSVKDFRWVARAPEASPLGAGQVSPEMMARIRHDYRGDYSLHVEYIEQAGPQANRAALASDVQTLRRLLAAADGKPAQPQRG